MLRGLHSAAMSGLKEKREPRSRYRADGARRRTKGERKARAPWADHWKAKKQAERERLLMVPRDDDNNWWTCEQAARLLATTQVHQNQRDGITQGKAEP